MNGRQGTPKRDRERNTHKCINWFNDYAWKRRCRKKWNLIEYLIWVLNCKIMFNLTTCDMFRAFRTFCMHYLFIYIINECVWIYQSWRLCAIKCISRSRNLIYIYMCVYFAAKYYYCWVLKNTFHANYWLWAGKKEREGSFFADKH